ncbi:MAG: hypothetical protein ACI4B3_08165 [Prevotella sp.]
MNKFLGIIAFLGILFTISSCEEKIQTTNAKVKSISDSTFVATIDKYDITFDTKDARYHNGAIMAGDSVTIHYTGDLRDKKAKALLVKLIPKQGKFIEIKYDPTKELKSKPMTSEEQKRLEEGIEFAKRHGH